jgi:myo-inositol-1(or 4)-monophosphatase
MDLKLQDELYELALTAARAAGDLLMNRPSKFDVTQKTSAVDFVTQMDKQSESLIIDLILGRRADDSILAEEGGNHTGNSGITWVVDPLDGTVNYFYDLPGWNISIAAMDSQGVQIGVVYAPSIDSLWAARKGKGATLNGAEIEVGQVEELAKSLITTGYSYELERRIEQGEVTSAIVPQVRDLRRFGAAAVDLCNVACGRVDGYFEYGLQPWDRAAGMLIASEAGAISTNLTGAEPDYEMIICANPTLQPKLLAAVSAAYRQARG